MLLVWSAKVACSLSVHTCIDHREVGLVFRVYRLVSEVVWIADFVLVEHGFDSSKQAVLTNVYVIDELFMCLVCGLQPCAVAIAG